MCVQGSLEIPIEVTAWAIVMLIDKLSKMGRSKYKEPVDGHFEDGIDGILRML